MYIKYFSHLIKIICIVLMKSVWALQGYGK